MILEISILRGSKKIIKSNINLKIIAECGHIIQIGTDSGTIAELLFHQEYLGLDQEVGLVSLKE